MLLCLEHHDEATNNVLDEHAQREAKVNPYNIVHGNAKGLLRVKQANSYVDLGGAKFLTDGGDLLKYKNETIIFTSISDDQNLLISLKLYDESDNLLAEIIDNEWISYTPLPWDIEYKYQKLHIRSAPRQIAVSIDCRSEPIKIRGKIWRNKHLIEFRENEIEYNGALFMGGGNVEGAYITFGGGGLALSPLRDSITITNSSVVTQPKQHPKYRLGKEIAGKTPCPCGSGKKYKRCCGIS